MDSIPFSKKRQELSYLAWKISCDIVRYATGISRVRRGIYSKVALPRCSGGFSDMIIRR